MLEFRRCFVWDTQYFLVAWDANNVHSFCLWGINCENNKFHILMHYNKYNNDSVFLPICFHQ